MDDLDDLLARRHRFGDMLAGGLGLNRFDEITGHREADISLQQGHAHFAQGGGDIGIGQRALLRQPVKHPTKAF